MDPALNDNTMPPGGRMSTVGEPSMSPSTQLPLLPFSPPAEASMLPMQSIALLPHGRVVSERKDPPPPPSALASHPAKRPRTQPQRQPSSAAAGDRHRIGFCITPIELTTGRPVGPSHIVGAACMAAIRMLAGETGNSMARLEVGPPHSKTQHPSAQHRVLTRF